MRLLLDTHIFLWYIANDKRLAPAWSQAIRDLDNEVYLSVVSLWEAIIKYGSREAASPGSTSNIHTEAASVSPDHQPPR